MQSPGAVVDHLFSRGVLGSMLVGTATGKVVEKTIVIVAPNSPHARLVGWSVALMVFLVFYVYWASFEDYVDDRTDDVQDGVSDALDGDADD